MSASKKIKNAREKEYVKPLKSQYTKIRKERRKKKSLMLGCFIVIFFAISFSIFLGRYSEKKRIEKIKESARKNIIRYNSISEFSEDEAKIYAILKRMLSYGWEVDAFGNSRFRENRGLTQAEINFSLSFLQKISNSELENMLDKFIRYELNADLTSEELNLYKLATSARYRQLSKEEIEWVANFLLEKNFSDIEFNRLLEKMRKKNIY